MVLGLAAGPARAAEARSAGEPVDAGREIGRPGGRLVVALRAEPSTFNPVLATDQPSLTVIRRLMADLIHVDRATQGTVPALAESWTRSPDGRRFEVELRRDVRFSDGHPMDADDVVFSFAVYLDPALASPYRGQLLVGGEPLRVRKLGSHTVSFELAEADAWGERLFNDLSILPRHRLAQAFADGRLTETWGLQAPPESIVGLGPFRLGRYVPGERLELERNPFYWKRDREGQRLPYLDQLSFLFVAGTDAQALRFQAGDTQLIDRLDADSFALLERGEGRDGGYRLRDLGPGLGYEFLFFNQNDLAGRGLAAIERKQRWFEQRAFRRALSSAIDRAGIVRLVYRGRATPVASHVSPGNRLWADAGLAPPERSPAAARELLRRAGFTWDDGGRLRDAEGEAVELTVITSASNRERLSIAAIVQDDLDQLGIGLEIVPLEFRSLIDRVLSSYDYEACLLGLGAGDGDPNAGLDVWTSSGGRHFWHLGQSRPATAWEAEVDRLLLEQKTTLDRGHRKRLNDRIQELVADQQPFIFLVSPHVLVGARNDLGNFAPAVLDHPTLWNAEELFWRRDAPAGR
jgi:peptide/nickel transport system substrate-binding protein